MEGLLSTGPTPSSFYPEPGNSEDNKIIFEPLGHCFKFTFDTWCNGLYCPKYAKESPCQVVWGSDNFSWFSSITTRPPFLHYTAHWALHCDACNVLRWTLHYTEQSTVLYVCTILNCFYYPKQCDALYYSVYWSSALHWTQHFIVMQCIALRTTLHCSTLYCMFALTQCSLCRSTDSLLQFHIIKTGLLAAAPLLAREAAHKYYTYSPSISIIIVSLIFLILMYPHLILVLSFFQSLVKWKVVLGPSHKKYRLICVCKYFTWQTKTKKSPTGLNWALLTKSSSSVLREAIRKKAAYFWTFSKRDGAGVNPNPKVVG